VIATVIDLGQVARLNQGKSAIAVTRLFLGIDVNIFFEEERET
jgi:hypothetical protein